jgi:hypothetical protein
MRRTRYLTAVLLIGTLVGCNAKVSTVTGKVTFQGKPIVFGTVSIIGPDGITRSGPIQPDGSFSVSDVGVGEGQVAVTSLKPPDGTDGKAKRGGRDAPDQEEERGAKPEAAAPAEVIKNWFPIPAKYGDHKQSGLTIKVDGKPVTLDLQ